MARPCYIIFNTKNGYCMQPRYFVSIKEAIECAKAEGMAFRLYDLNDRLIKKGWY